MQLCALADRVISLTWVIVVLNPSRPGHVCVDLQCAVVSSIPRHRTQSGSRAMNAGIAFQM